MNQRAENIDWGALARPAMAVHLAVTAVLVTINISPLINSWSVAALFELNAESNASVWFSSTSLLLIAALAAGLAVRDPGSHRLGWGLVAAFFALLSLDETASIHELVGLLFSERVAELQALPGLYAWVAIVAPPALIIALVMARWILRRIPAGYSARWLVPTAIAIWCCVPLAEFLDPILGMPRALVVLEEALELIGMALMLGALLEISGPPKPRSGRDSVTNRVLDRVAEPI
ncbi:MAG: hypothetical protein GKS06_03660 [Acidobacteria bacterium]|nr:hypothetical protein [Acidobacteriota bacterium]